MKKIIVFILISLLICGTKLTCVQNFTLSELFPNAQIEVYLPQKIENCGFYTINNGEGCIIFAKMDDLQYILSKYNVGGYTLKLYGLNFREVVEKINPNYFYNFDKYIYGHKTNLFDKDVEGINFQCAQQSNCVLLGVPILLGSY